MFRQLTLTAMLLLTIGCSSAKKFDEVIIDEFSEPISKNEQVVDSLAIEDILTFSNQTRLFEHIERFESYPEISSIMSLPIDKRYNIFWSNHETQYYSQRQVKKHLQRWPDNINDQAGFDSRVPPGYQMIEEARFDKPLDPINAMLAQSAFFGGPGNVMIGLMPDIMDEYLTWVKVDDNLFNLVDSLNINLMQLFGDLYVPIKIGEDNFIEALKHAHEYLLPVNQYEIDLDDPNLFLISDVMNSSLLITPNEMLYVKSDSNVTYEVDTLNGEKHFENANLKKRSYDDNQMKIIYKIEEIVTSQGYNFDIDRIRFNGAQFMDPRDSSMIYLDVRYDDLRTLLLIKDWKLPKDTLLELIPILE